MLKFRNSYNTGNSLLEMAISLTICGLIAGITIPTFVKYQHYSSAMKTKEHQEMILKSIGIFLNNFGCLPTPADPSALGENFGKQHLKESRNDPINAIGIIPFRDLGLPESTAKDGFGRYITYAVEPNLARNISTGTQDGLGWSFCTEIGGGKNLDSHHLQVGGQSTDLIVTNAKDCVAVILIGHGQTGHGAFLCNGSRKKHTSKGASEAEEINATDSLYFKDVPYSTKKGKRFQHSIKWITRNNLAAHFGHYYCQRSTNNQTLHTEVCLDVDAPPSGPDLSLFLEQ